MPIVNSNLCSQYCRPCPWRAGWPPGTAAAAALTLRWRLANRVGRQQLKWFLAVLPLTAVSLILYPISALGPLCFGLGVVGRLADAAGDRHCGVAVPAI